VVSWGFLVMFLLAVSVLPAGGHAVLQTPTPFNTQPSTASPCGVGSVSENMKSVAQASWTAGSSVTIGWHLVAADGGGNLMGMFDPNGGTNFTVPAWTDTFTTQGTNVFYNKTFTVPESLNCNNSPTKLCTLRVYTSSNWNSCTMIDIVTPDCTDCPTAAPRARVCTPVTTPLGFCNGTSVFIENGTAPGDISSELLATFNANRANPNVFISGNSTACMASYQQLLCSLSLPQCDLGSGAVLASTQACHSQCEQVMSDCGIVQAHIDLYPCSSYPLCQGESDGGSGGGLSAGGKAVIAICVIAIVGALLSCVYVYYTKGQLLGYAYNRTTRRWGRVAVPAGGSSSYIAYEDQQ